MKRRPARYSPLTLHLFGWIPKARGIINLCHTFLSSEGMWIESKRRKSFLAWLTLMDWLGSSSPRSAGPACWRRPTVRRPRRWPAIRFPPAAVEFFEARVRPILVDQCMKCHGPKKQSSGLRLDSREAVLEGGESGPAVVPYKADESLLVQAVTHTHAELKMPPSGKLPEPAVAILRQWVSLGAPWSVGAAKGLPEVGASASITAAAGHWAFQPVRRPVPPTVNDREWLRTPLDAFVLARLEDAGLAPSPEADKRTVIRRATIDLWGIPPTAEEVDAF